jgi:hypothetical protein
MEKIKYPKSDIDDVKALLKSLDDIIKSGDSSPAIAKARKNVADQIERMKKGYPRYVVAATCRRKDGSNEYVDRYGGDVKLQDSDDGMAHYIYAKNDEDAIGQMDAFMKSFEAKSEDGSDINNRYILWKSTDKSKPLAERHTSFYPRISRKSE